MKEHRLREVHVVISSSTALDYPSSMLLTNMNAVYKSGIIEDYSWFNRTWWLGTVACWMFQLFTPASSIPVVLE